MCCLCIGQRGMLDVLCVCGGGGCSGYFARSRVVGPPDLHPTTQRLDGIIPTLTLSLVSTSADDQVVMVAFWAISRPDTATPPAQQCSSSSSSSSSIQRELHMHFTCASFLMPHPETDILPPAMAASCCITLLAVGLQQRLILCHALTGPPLPSELSYLHCKPCRCQHLTFAVETVCPPPLP